MSKYTAYSLQTSLLTDDTLDTSCVIVYINLHTGLTMAWYFKPEYVAKSIQIIKCYHLRLH
jgi:hypothetical protein